MHFSLLSAKCLAASSSSQLLLQQWSNKIIENSSDNIVGKLGAAAEHLIVSSENTFVR